MASPKKFPLPPGIYIRFKKLVLDMVEKPLMAEKAVERGPLFC
jgi:hypothetical protein